MLSDFVKNEIFMSCEYIKSHNLTPKKGSVINIIGEHFLCDYISDTIESLNNKTEYGYSVYQGNFSDTLISTVSRQCFLYCIDARENGSYSIADLEKALQYASKINEAQFVVLVIIPSFEEREDVLAVSEIELSKLLSNTVLTEIEDTLSSYCDRLNIKEIRFDNFLIEDRDDNQLNLTAIVNQAINTKSVDIKASDAFNVVSAISMSDAINSIFTVIKNGKHGNVYNASGAPMSLYEVKSFLYETLCTYGVKLELNNTEAQKNKAYCVLDTGKLNSIGYSPICDNKTRLLYAMCDILPEEYNVIDQKIDGIYNGKLKYIREMELELLFTVDRLCRDNGIQYFLSGGTMLGAVRHKGFIPWDDDIDIAFLREDYKRFKEVCKEKLPKKYQYQSFTNKDGYHYFFDKITIKDTYFSTKYSDKFDMFKGISMDIFVFDKTSDKEFFQKMHFNSLMRMRLLMNLRWINCARKDKHYMLSKILLPFLRLFSMDTYSKWYDRKLRKYEKRNTNTVLAPATDHIWRGVMPKRWFENVVDAQFDGVMSYIPTGYDNYLKQWYGDDYMELLPLSMRVGSHDFYRLDIGNEIKTKEDYDIKHYNYKGELL